MVSHPARKASAIAAVFCGHDRGDDHRSEQLTLKIEMADSSQANQGPRVSDHHPADHAKAQLRGRR
jgi:hypothetical protein